MAFDKAEYWANRGKKKPKATVGALTFVCGPCMDWAMEQKDPRARHLLVRAAARGPWEKLPVKTADGQTAYKHVGCPRQ